MVKSGYPFLNVGNQLTWFNKIKHWAGGWKSTEVSDVAQEPPVSSMIPSSVGDRQGFGVLNKQWKTGKPPGREEAATRLGRCGGRRTLVSARRVQWKGSKCPNHC